MTSIGEAMSRNWFRVYNITASPPHMSEWLR